MPKKTLLTPAEVSEITGLDAQRVRYRCRAGEVPGAVSHGSGNRTIWEIPNTKAALDACRPIGSGRPRKTGPTAAKKV